MNVLVGATYVAVLETMPAPQGEWEKQDVKWHKNVKWNENYGGTRVRTGRSIKVSGSNNRKAK
jgi:hypothetical protein